MLNDADNTIKEFFLEITDISRCDRTIQNVYLFRQVIFPVGQRFLLCLCEDPRIFASRSIKCPTALTNRRNHVSGANICVEDVHINKVCFASAINAFHKAQKCLCW